MQICEFGCSGLKVFVLGLGCMGLIYVYGQLVELSQGIVLLYVVVECGVIFFDIVEVYGLYINEDLFGQVLVFYCDRLVIVIKFGFKDVCIDVGLDSCLENICVVVEVSFKCLCIDYIDLFYQYCVDLNVLIEDVVGIVSDLIVEGKVGYFGLFEVSVVIVCCVYVVQLVIVVQSEYLLWWCELECELLLMLQELGIGFVLFSLLGRGFLIGVINVDIIFDVNDFCNSVLCFEVEVCCVNQVLVDCISMIVVVCGVMFVQVVLVWLFVQVLWIVLILGIIKVYCLEENLGVVDLQLVLEEL